MSEEEKFQYKKDVIDKNIITKKDFEDLIVKLRQDNDIRHLSNDEFSMFIFGKPFNVLVGERINKNEI